MALRVLPTRWSGTLVTVLLTILCQAALAQNQTAKVTPNGIWYYEYLPPDYNSNNNKYPVVFFFHGLGERGDTEADLPAVAKNGPPKHVKNGYKFPFILISPQLKKNKTGWPNSYMDQVIEHCKTYLRIDLSRLYITGLSLGGGGSWGYTQDAVLGQKVAAAAIVCGSSNNTGKACSFGLTNLPVWAFHGDADGTVSVNKSIRMVDAINNCNPAPNPLAKLTIYPGVGHNSWDRAYLTDNSLHTPNLYQWLLQFRNDGIVVNAGDDKTVNLPTTTTTLTGTASIPNGTITSWAWTKVNGPAASMSNASTPTLSLTNLVAGVYTFRLTVTASNGETAQDDVVLTVVQTNLPPVANAGPDISLTLPTNSFTITGTGSDSDGSVASYLWTKVSGPSATLGGTTTSRLALSNLVEGTYVFAFRVTDNSGATAEDRVTVVVNPPEVNEPPTAQAGPDRTINLPQSTTTITGTGSDPDGSIASYQWEKVSGPNVTMAGAASATLSLSNLQAGVYVFRFRVTDNGGAVDTDEITVTVLAANQTPVANAGDDIDLTLPINSTNLIGSGSDADGSIVSYAWTRVSGPSAPPIVNASSATASVSGLLEGTYVFRLTVEDDRGATAIDEVSVVVNPEIANSAPVANAGGNKTINLPTTSTSLIGSGSDSDGSIASYAWTKLSGPAATMTNTSSSTLLLANLVAGVYEFQLVVTDDDGATASDIATVTVIAANQSPVANAGSDFSVILPTSSTTLDGSGFDPDGSIESYEWVLVSGPSTPVIENPANASTSISDLVEGDYTFQLTVTDNSGSTSSDEITVSVLASGTNAPPRVSAGADRTIQLPENSTELTANAFDEDGTISTYEWELISGGAHTLSGEATATLEVSDMEAGSYVFRITVTDDDGATASDEIAVTVQPELVNQSPVANAGNNRIITLPMSSGTINGSGSDPDGTIESYLWEKVSGPTVTMSNEDTPDLEIDDLVEGVYVFQLTVTDDKGATDSDQVQVTVTAQNQNPVADAGTDISINLPDDFTTLNGTASDSDGTIASYAWSQVSGPSTAAIATPSQASTEVTDLQEGTYVFNLLVTDDDGGTANDQVKVIVNSVNLAPSVTINTNRNITFPLNKTTFTATGTDTDGTIASYVWTQVSGPATATLTNDMTPTVTVTVEVAGTYWFRVTVTDNEGATAFAESRLIVNEANVNQPPTANAGTNKTITLPMNAINLEGSGSDPDGSIATYQWSKVSGPAATITNANTPTVSLSNLVEGTYVMRLTVTDNRGATATASVSVSVLAAVVNVPPVAEAGPNRTLTLPVNSTNITGSGSDTDGTIVTYTWTKVSGPAVTMSNTSLATVSLADLVEGTYVFRLTVTDDKGATAKDEMTLTVNAETANQAPIANAGTDRTTTLPHNSLEITGSGSDADGSIASYAWSKVSGPSVTMGGQSTATLALSNLLEGSYVFRLTVTDDDGAKATDDVKVTVFPATTNQSPVADAGSDQIITLPRDHTTLLGSGSDSDGTVTTYEWQKVSGPAATLENAATPTLTVSAMVSGTYVFRLTVTDDQGAIDSDDVKVTVNPEDTNEAPVAHAGPDQTITLPTTITTLDGSGSDSDGTITAYSWIKVSGPTVTLSQADQPSASLSNLVEGSYVFRLEVTDDDGAKDTDDITITVLPADVNKIPVVHAGTDVTIFEPATSVSLEGTASDSDGSIATVSWTQEAGGAAAIATPNTLFTSVTGLAVGSYRFRLTVTDDDGASAFDEIIVTVNEANTNQPPVANAGPNRTVKLPDNAIVINGSGSDPDGTIASYLWEKVSGPSVTMSGTATADLSLEDLMAGTYSFRLTVTDDDDASHSDIVQVSVLPADINLPPVANAGGDRTLDLPDNEVTLTGTVQDEDVATVTFLWTKVSGPEATLTGADQAQLTISDLVEGAYTFRLTVTDDQGMSDSDDVNVTVFAEFVMPEPPTVTLGDDIEIQLPDNSVQLEARATSEESLITSYQWQQTLGETVNFDPEAENFLLLENLSPGLYTFVVTVTDAEGNTAFDDVTISVLEEEPAIRPRKLFSPDHKGDLETETWVIENAHLLENCEILVYDRQGQKVYSSVGYPVPWDGTYNGRPLPDGAYFYVIRCGDRVFRKGSVTIARLR